MTSGFLDDQMDDEGDGFLDGHLSEPDGFLDGELDENEESDEMFPDCINEIPTAYSLPDEELKRLDWPDHWVDSTDEFYDVATFMKAVDCECGRSLCVSKTNRTMSCSDCGLIHIDFNWEDKRLE